MNYPTDEYYSDEAYDTEATHGISLSTNFEIRPNRLRRCCLHDELSRANTHAPLPQVVSSSHSTQLNRIHGEHMGVKSSQSSHKHSTLISELITLNFVMWFFFSISFILFHFFNTLFTKNNPTCFHLCIVLAFIYILLTTRVRRWFKHRDYIFLFFFINFFIRFLQKKTCVFSSLYCTWIYTFF